MNVTLEVDRADLHTTRLLEADPVALEAGQVRLRIDRFALTANNVTYAVAGDMLGYWDFFPADDGWGRVPAMGWAEVVESAHPDVEVGGRYYGWYPMAREITMTVGVTADGLRDDGPHRAAHAPAYRGYTRTDRDGWYDPAPDGEDRQCLLRGLFLTGFLLDSNLADHGDHGADRLVVLSASSKTAIGFAVCAAARGAHVVGVTSAGNAEFVRSLGLYGTVLTYDEVDELAADRVVVIDIAGDRGVLARVHARLDDAIAASITVGISHHDAPPAEVTAGPTPEMFFAPGEITRRIEAWGRDGYAERTTAALAAFVEASRSWLTVERIDGPDAADQAWAEALDGAVGPDVGRTVSLHDPVSP
jgi:hypothetical protein